MLEIPDPLAELRDIRLPPDPSWWPPAPGWWFLGILFLLALVLLLLWMKHGFTQGRPAREARRLLMNIESHWQAGADPGNTAQSLSELLRRYLLARFPDERVAGLQGQRLAAFLIEAYPVPGWPRLWLEDALEAVYRPDPDTVDQLLAVVRTIIHARARSSPLSTTGIRDVVSSCANHQPRMVK